MVPIVTTMKETRTKFTTLFIDPVAIKKIHYYAQAADGEVSGLGTLIKDSEGRYVVNKVFLLDQESSGADTELNPEAISKLMVDMIGKNEDPAQLKFWWHSHANMGVFWSGTDDACAETLSHEFAFSLVVNKSREMKCRLDLYNPFRITFDGIKVTELFPEDSSLKKECEKEVKEKVKAPGWKWKDRFDQGNDYHYPGYDDGYYGSEYGSHVKQGAHHWPIVPGKNFSLFKDKKRIKLPEIVVEDIEHLVDIADKFQTSGGIFIKDTWDEYIIETMKTVVEKRLEKKAACTAPLTFDKETTICTDGKCKVQKACAYWTKVFLETEEDAQKELTEMETSPDQPNDIIVV